MGDFTALYCLRNEFCKGFEPVLNADLLTNGEKRRWQQYQRGL